MNQNKIIYFLIVLFLIIGCKKVEKVYYPDGSLAAEYSIKNNKKRESLINTIKWEIKLPK